MRGVSERFCEFQSPQTIESKMMMGDKSKYLPTHDSSDGATPIQRLEECCEFRSLIMWFNQIA